MTWIAAGIASGAATMAGVQAIKGKQDQAKANKNRPQYDIPQEAYQNLDQATQQSLQGLPEAQKQQYLNNLQQASAYSLAQSSSRKGGLTGVAALNQNQIQGNQNLLSQDAAARMNNIHNVYAQRNQLADYKGQKFQLDKLNPYYENLAQKQARNAALFQNLNNAAGIASFGGGKGMGGNVGGSDQYKYVDQNQINQQKVSNSNYGNYDPYFNQQGIVPDNSYDISNIG